MWTDVKDMENDSGAVGAGSDQFGRSYGGFQRVLKDIKSWDSSILSQETARMIQACDSLQLRKLYDITVLSRYLTMERDLGRELTGGADRPTFEQFVHLCYRDIARHVYQNPAICDTDSDDLTTGEIQQNLRTLHDIVENSIETTLIKVVPIQTLLNDIDQQSFIEMNRDHDVRAQSGGLFGGYSSDNDDDDDDDSDDSDDSDDNDDDNDDASESSSDEEPETMQTGGDVVAAPTPAPPAPPAPPVPTLQTLNLDMDDPTVNDESESELESKDEVETEPEPEPVKQTTPSDMTGLSDLMVVKRSDVEMIVDEHSTPGPVKTIDVPYTRPAAGVRDSGTRPVRHIPRASLVQRPYRTTTDTSYNQLLKTATASVLDHTKKSDIRSTELKLDESV